MIHGEQEVRKAAGSTDAFFLVDMESILQMSEAEFEAHFEFTKRTDVEVTENLTLSALMV